MSSSWLAAAAAARTATMSAARASGVIVALIRIASTWQALEHTALRAPAWNHYTIIWASQHRLQRVERESSSAGRGAMGARRARRDCRRLSRRLRATTPQPRSRSDAARIIRPITHRPTTYYSDLFAHA